MGIMFLKYVTYPCILFFPWTCDTLDILLICINLTDLHTHIFYLPTQKRPFLCAQMQQIFLLCPAASFRKIREYFSLLPYLTFLLSMNSSLTAPANIYEYLYVISVVEMKPEGL